MVLTLLLVTFIISLVVSWLVMNFFDKPVRALLQRILADEVSLVWARYLSFAVIVVGISSGVRVWDFEKYLDPAREGAIVALTRERWIIEIYRTVIGSLQGIAWLLLVFFIFALIAFVIIRIFEMKRASDKS